MESYLSSEHFDLITPDGEIKEIKEIDSKTRRATCLIKNISEAFLGFQIDEKNILFNLKSTLAQLGINANLKNLLLNKKKKQAEVTLDLIAHSNIAKKMLKLLSSQNYIGKLFAQEKSRKVRNPEYLIRMFERKDLQNRPLLSFGHKKETFFLEKKAGYTIAFLPIKKGVVSYLKEINNFIFALSKILNYKNYPTRNLLKLYQKFEAQEKVLLKPNDMLLVRTQPLYIRTVFAKVVEEYLPKGFHHTSACILEPNTLASGDIYEFYGFSKYNLENIPLEFYTLEPHREYVFFEDRDQLQEKLEDPKVLFNAIKTAPKPKSYLASVFVVKGTQLETLNEKDWILRNPKKHEFPGLNEPEKQSFLVNQYIKEQPSYPFLKAIEDGLITSQGILLSRHFPSPLIKRMLLSNLIQENLKRIYFQYPSKSNDDYFSQEDRSFLLDLAKFAIPTYWIDKTSKKLLQYVVRSPKDIGMFVPTNLINIFKKATFFGVYGSNLISGDFEKELEKLLKGILKLKETTQHPLLSNNIPIALVTGGGPGVMEVGNKVAKNLNILSCANIIDFRAKKEAVINEQKINPYIDAKMTYRLERLVERQAEFHLDFPIFLMGGIGTDFEFLLEEIKRKTGAAEATPVLLFGENSYWKAKITPRFQINLKTGTIKGSEWVSNCFYPIQTAEQGLKIYKDFFENKLPIGKNGPMYETGFCENN